MRAPACVDRWRARPRSRPTAGRSRALRAAETAASLEGLTADSIATAYQFPALYGAGDFGQGQTVGLIEIGPFNQSDIATYDACYGITGSVTPVPVAGGSTPDRERRRDGA